MPKRSVAQKAQFEAACSARRQDGGLGSSGSALNTTLAEQTQQLRATKSALGHAHHALEEAKMELEQQKQHSAVLYNSLRVVRRKQQRTNAAKSAALEKMIETMSLVDQLKMEN